MMSHEKEKVRKDKEDDPWGEARNGEEIVEPKQSTFSKRLRARLRKTRTKKQKPARKWTASRWGNTRKPTMRTLKCAVALVLFMLYFITTVTSASVRPNILVLFLPTLWILLDYVRLNWNLSNREGNAK